MRYGFIRALWGIHEHKGRRFYMRRSKIDNDIELVRHNAYGEKFITYVFGKDNYSYLVDKGFSCKLLDDRPIVWDMDSQQFRHKLEVFKAAAGDFDRFVFLDWDVLFVKPLPSNFWDVLAQKYPLQCILRIYHQKKTFWRAADTRKIPCGSFTYIGDKGIPDKLIEYWQKSDNKWSEEIVIARYTDDIMGGFDMDKYWKMFEPMYFHLQNLFPKELNDKKDIVFKHFNAGEVSRQLQLIKKGNNLPKWLKLTV